MGAGPGDPGLISVRGLQRLRQADVVVFDALVSPALLRQAPEDAELIDAGKRPGQQTLTQDQINELLVRKAREGNQVVRLKAGDPYLFGRGAEEIAHLARHGIPCEVIPGITAGIAAPALAGIPLTHRRYASSLTLVTGQEDPTKPQSAVDYAALAQLIRLGNTVCFYMGARRLAEITAELIRHGTDPATPAAIIQWGTTPRQKTVRASLDQLAQAAAAAAIGSPAIIVVGSVVALQEPGLDFFVRRPLFGKTVVVTRPRHQSSDMTALLEELGALVLEAPCIEVLPPENWSRLDQAISQIHRYDWLVLTSVNGVAALAQRLKALERDSRHLAGVRIAAIGQATAQSLTEQLSIHADLIPTQFIAEALVADLLARESVTGKRFLLLRSDVARPALPHLLEQAGALVEEVVAYRTQPVAALPSEVLTALQNRQVHWICFTSSSTVRSFVNLLGSDRSLLRQVRIASIGPITTQTLQELDLPPTVEAAIYTTQGLIEAIVRYETGSS